MKDWKALLYFYAATFAVQVGGNFFTMQSVTTWYTTLEKSTLTPPGYWFGIVWTLLYIIMAVAAWRVWRVQRQGFFSRTLQWWWAQLTLGLVWCGVFFGLRLIDAGLVIIFINWLVILATIARFLCVERMAGYLLVPLGLWMTFATYLNLVISLKN